MAQPPEPSRAFDRRQAGQPGSVLLVRPGRLHIGVDVRVGAGQAEVAASLQVERLAAALHYEVIASGFDDPSHYGSAPIRSLFTPAESGEWRVDGDSYRLLISNWRGPRDGLREATAWMRQRFAGMHIRVMVRCP